MEGAVSRQCRGLWRGIRVLLGAAGGCGLSGDGPLAVRLWLPRHRYRLRPRQWDAPLPVRRTDLRAGLEGGLQLLGRMPAVPMAPGSLAGEIARHDAENTAFQGSRFVRVVHGGRLAGGLAAS